MAARDAADLVETYRAAFRDCLLRINEPSLLHLRGELQVLLRWLESRNDAGRTAAARNALDAISRFYAFGAEIGGFERSSKSAGQASVFDLASVGVLAVENVLTAENRSLMRYLMSGLSEGLMFLASRQYVAGSEAVLEGTYKANALSVRDALWGLARDFRSSEDLASIREARDAIDALFAKLDSPGVDLHAKVSLLHQLYGLVAIVRCAQLLERLQGLA
ncbi:MAG TPA: hypothetical protein VEY12_13060 [Thermoplasmata archaeon]|nr:hypothetical protein [Thermoplasmata archaeon]